MEGQYYIFSRFFCLLLTSVQKSSHNVLPCRDVDTIIKDLMDASLTLVKELRAVSAKEEVGPIVENKLIEALTGPGASPDTIASFRTLLQDGVLEDRDITVDVPVKESGGGARGNISVGMGGMSDMEVSVAGMGGPGGTVDLAELMSRLSGSGKSGRPITHRRNMTVREARIALEEAEVDRVLSSLDLRKEAVTLAEQNGIVFIDEIDKLISNKSKHSGDASSEGVQRDLLPLIEGTTVDVKYVPFLSMAIEFRRAFCLSFAYLVFCSSFLSNPSHFYFLLYSGALGMSAQIICSSSPPELFTLTSPRNYSLNYKEDCPFAWSCKH